MDLSHLMTCCTLRCEVAAEQMAFFLSAPFRLTEETQKSNSDYMKHTNAIPKNQTGPLQAAPYAELMGKGWQGLKGNFPSLPSSRWRTFPRKCLLEAFADTECCQGKGPLVGLLLPFLTGENQNTLKVGKALKGQVLTEGPDGRSLMKHLREVLILDWWLATDSWHKDFQCNTTTHRRCV